MTFQRLSNDFLVTFSDFLVIFTMFLRLFVVCRKAQQQKKTKKKKRKKKPLTCGGCLIFPSRASLTHLLGLLRFLSSASLGGVDSGNYKKTIEINPSISEAYNNLGIALKNIDNKKESIECFIKALNFNSKNAQACENLIKVLTNIDYDKNQDNKYIYVNN